MRVTLLQLKKRICKELTISEYDIERKSNRQSVYARALYFSAARNISSNREEIRSEINAQLDSYYKSLNRHKRFKANSDYKELNNKILEWLRSK